MIRGRSRRRIRRAPAGGFGCLVDEIREGIGGADMLGMRLLSSTFRTVWCGVSGGRSYGCVSGAGRLDASGAQEA